MTNFTHVEGTFTLDNSISLYIPTVYQNHSPIPTEEVEKYKRVVADRLADFFGGVTETEGKGYFKHSTGEVQEEKVFILSSFADDESLTQNAKKLKTLAHLLAIALLQESVLLVVNGVAGFYEQSK
jgi:hypothetical protein